MKGKGNDGSGNNENRDDWETPDIVFLPLNKEYNFTFDCCASPNNKKCEKFSSDFLNENNLKDEICWINPPFSKAKEMFKHFFKVCKKGVAIYRCDNMETKVWQEIILPNASWIFIPKGRVSYYYNPTLRNGNGTRFPSALIGLNVEPINIFEGFFLKPLNKEMKKIQNI